MKFLYWLFGGEIPSEVNRDGFPGDGEFAKFYNEKLRSEAIAIDEERIRYRKELISRSRIALVAVTLLTVLFIYLFNLPIKNPEVEKYVVSGFFVLAITIASWPGFMMWEYRDVKGNLFKKIFEFYNLVYVPHNGWQAGDYDIFYTIPSSSEDNSQDRIVGKYKNVGFCYDEVCLTTGLGKKRKIVSFDGIMILFNFNKNLQGRTIVKQDSGKYKDLEKVTLEDPEFEKMFKVFSSDQIEARYVLTTSFMERVKKLSDFFHSKDVSAEFHQNQLLLMFNTRCNLFEASSLFKEVNAIADCTRVVEQLQLIFDVADVLQLDQKTRL